MNIEKYPQYQLYKFTLLLEENKAMYIKPDIESRAVDGTIINRAYYSDLNKSGNMKQKGKNMFLNIGKLEIA